MFRTGIGKVRSFPLLGVTVTGVVLALGITGCSSSDKDRRDYAVPADLCGVPMPSSVLEPLLPGGKKIASQAANTEGLRACKVLVDGKLAVSASVERWKHGTTFQKVMSATPGLDDQTGSDTGAAVASSTTGLSLVRCSPSPPHDEEVFATIRAESSSPGEDAVRKAIAAYADGAADSAGCTS